MIRLLLTINRTGMDDKDYYTGEITWNIPANVREEIATLAEYRHRVKVLKQNPEDVYMRILNKELEKIILHGK